MKCTSPAYVVKRFMTFLTWADHGRYVIGALPPSRKIVARYTAAEGRRRRFVRPRFPFPLGRLLNRQSRRLPRQSRETGAKCQH